MTGLAQLIRDGFAVEKPNDRAATVEQTHPVVADKLTAATTSCSGEFLPFDATEVAFVIECQVTEATPPGRPAPRAQLAASRFDIRLPGNRQVTNWLGPAGFSCAPRTRVTANDSLSCTGTLNAGTPVGGNIRMSPGPVTGMGGQLVVTVGAAERGPFAITGP